MLNRTSDTSIFRIRFFCEISLDLYVRRADVEERLNFILENLFATYRGTESIVFLCRRELRDFKAVYLFQMSILPLLLYARMCSRAYCIPDLLISSLHYWNPRRPIRKLDFFSMLANPLLIVTSSRIGKLSVFAIPEKLEWFYTLTCNILMWIINWSAYWNVE